MGVEIVRHDPLPQPPTAIKSVTLTSAANITSITVKANPTDITVQFLRNGVGLAGGVYTVEDVRQCAAALLELCNGIEGRRY